jgi:hypothetical protein
MNFTLKKQQISTQNLHTTSPQKEKPKKKKEKKNPTIDKAPMIIKLKQNHQRSSKITQTQIRIFNSRPKKKNQNRKREEEKQRERLNLARPVLDDDVATLANGTSLLRVGL